MPGRAESAVKNAPIAPERHTQGPTVPHQPFLAAPALFVGIGRGSGRRLPLGGGNASAAAARLATCSSIMRELFCKAQTPAQADGIIMIFVMVASANHTPLRS